MKEKYILELEEGVYFIGWFGGIRRTLKIDSAKEFKFKKQAELELENCRKFHPFVNAKIIEQN
jgi:hypothetical protein